VQEFISEAKACDIRCFVIGNQVVASIMRKGPKDEFRSNLHRGGMAVSIEISDYEKELVLKVASMMELEVCGVDLLRSKRGPLIMEVNASPGFEGIERVTGINIAGLMMDRLEVLINHDHSFQQ
jgi:ribosomal protein S6--L-glutamate ligase